MSDEKPDPKATVSDDARAAKQIIFGEQAALMLNVDQILNKFTSGSLAPRNTIQYNYFSTVRNVNKSTSTDIFTITSLLSKNPDMEEFFYKLSPAVLSLIQPSIKIYKTFYTVKSSETGPSLSRRGYDWKIPFDDMTVGEENSSESSEFIDNTLNNILSGEGRLNGVGLKSFNYSYKGTNPAEVNTNIAATLELFIQSPDSLLKKININNTDPRFVTGKNNIQNLPSDLSFAYSDLVNLSSRFKRTDTSQNGDLEPNLHYYRIKVVAGYSAPPDYYFENIGIVGDDLKKIKNAIRASKVILWLTPYSHSFDFNENGNITLKIDYNASVDRIMTSNDADVLKISEEYEKFIKAKKEYQSAASNKEREIKKIRCQFGNKSITKKQQEEQIKSVEDKYKIDDIIAAYKQASTVMYASIMRSLLNLDGTSSPRPKIFSVQLHPSAIGVTDAKEDAPWWAIGGSLFNVGGEALEQADVLRIQNIKKSRTINNLYPVNADFIKEIKKQLKEGVAEKKDSNEVTRHNADLEAKRDEAKVDSENFVKVNFVFLGDILDAALSCLRYINPKNDIPRIILGNILLEIPTDYVGLEGSTKALTKKEVVSLADIPISFQSLYSFLIDKIVRQGKTSYPVLNFIRDIITQLVVTSVSPKYFGQSAQINSSIRVSTLHIAAPLKSDNTDHIINFNSSNFNKGSAMPSIDIAELLSNKNVIMQALQTDPEELLANDIASYLFIYCSSQFNGVREGDIKADSKDGIFHFSVGRDSGIIKKIQFSQTDTPFYREAVAAQEGLDNVSMIKQRYNAKIEMFGNHIYRPGDIVYIEPYVSFIKNEKVIASNLQEAVGIGGYYLVNDVESALNENIFSTTINCVHKAFNKKASDKDNSNCN